MWRGTLTTTIPPQAKNWLVVEFITSKSLYSYLPTLTEIAALVGGEDKIAVMA